MIRIDEIYSNTFVPLIQSRPHQCAHFFDPFGSTDFANLCQVPYITSMDRNFLFWDQEPFYPDIHSATLNEFFSHFVSEETVIVTSEYHSENIEWACDHYGMKSAYYFFHGWAAVDWYRGYDRTFLSRPFRDRDIQKTFLCPNNIIGGRRRHRLELFAELVDRELVGNNFVSFPDRCPYENKTVAELCVEYDIPLASVDLPLKIDQGSHYENDSHRIDMWALADQSLLHVVTETLYSGRRSHLTEKTFKPIVLQQPFVLVSCQGSLEYLRRYGFQTFGEFWNEDYDYYDDATRIMRIGKLLNDLNDLSAKEKINLQKHLAPIVEHNFNWFYSREFENLLWQELLHMTQSW
jgi:hypothetical protein